MTAVINGLLGLLVAVTWLGCLGFARLRSPLDRLHCAGFVNAATGVLLAAVAFAADGPSDRAFKVLLTVAVSLVAGSALSHAIGRALLYRGRFGELGTREP